MTTAELVVRRRCRRFTVAAVMAMAAMLFAAFTAAYLMRRAGRDWQPVPLPAILQLTTAVLVAASVTAEVARRETGVRWMLATLALGIAFVAGQVIAWGELRAAGFGGPDFVHGSFFLALCSVHAVHVFGGLTFLASALRRRELRGLAAGFWHFVGILWLWLYLMLSQL